jgi:hypothetical protein
MRAVKRIGIGWLAFCGLATAAAFVVRAFAPEYGDESTETFSVVASMSGRHFVSESGSLRFGSVVAFMGGAEIDLRDSEIVDGATIKVWSVMGGVDIFVPDRWRVEARPRVIMGGFDNRTSPDDASADSPLLIVDAVVLMGGAGMRTEEAA